MIRTLTFNREDDNSWFVVLPEWTGAKADLAMVEGADDFLEKLGDGAPKVEVQVASVNFWGASTLELDKATPERGGGGHYNLLSEDGSEIVTKMWLCKVLQFVFHGILPLNIYIKQV